MTARWRRQRGGNLRGQAALKRLGARVGWPAVVNAGAAVKGKRWEQFHQRHGEWGRRRRCGWGVGGGGIG
jgi:hypothetical protein